MNKASIFMVVLFFMQFYAYGQQKILMNSGEVKEAYGVKIDNKQGLLFYKNKKGHVKWELLSEVFSYQREDSVNVVFYKADCEDACFKTEQMRRYLEGYADGASEKTFGALGSGIIAGGLSGYYFTKIGLTIFVPLPPAVTAGAFGLFRPKAKNFSALDNYKDDPHYTEGYLQRVKRKRTFCNLLPANCFNYYCEGFAVFNFQFRR